MSFTEEDFREMLSQIQKKALKDNGGKEFVVYFRTAEGYLNFQKGIEEQHKQYLKKTTDEQSTDNE